MSSRSLDKDDAEGYLVPLKFRPGPNAGKVEKMMTPKFVLVVWTMMNFFTYFDRGAIAAALPSVTDDHSIDGGKHPLTNAAGGALVSAFMVGFFATCPVFAALGGKFSAKQIIVFGLIVWALACLSTGMSQDYVWILVSRMFVGVGEAAYAGYTVTIIDNMAPAKSRTLWIGAFYSMIPVGTALGMAVSGILSPKTFGSFAGWRLVFFAEVVPMLPIIVLNAMLPKKYNPVSENRGTAEEKAGLVSSEQSMATEANLANSEAAAVAKGDNENTAADTEGLDDFVTLPAAIKLLACNLDWILLVFGYAMYTFVIGGIAVWAISMLEESPLHRPSTSASLFLGGATAFGGLVGSMLGGKFVDKMGGSKGAKGLVACQKFNVTVMIIALPCGMVALLTNSFALFATLFLIGIFCAMSVTAPITAAMLNVVPNNLRTYSVSFSVFFMHMLGDFPSPIIAGKISDSFDGGCSALSDMGNTTCLLHKDCWYKAAANKHESPSCVNTYQLRYAVLIVWCMLFLCVPAWSVVLCRAFKRAKIEQMVEDNNTEGIN